MSRKPSPTMVGYARVSTDEQSTAAQSAELKAAGCTIIHEEHASGASRTRPVLARSLKLIESGQTLVVVRIDRLARSLAHLLQIIEMLEQRGAHFRSLHDPIDTSSPQGKFTLQILGAVAEFERALIRERTRAGLSAAQKAGRRSGNPRMRSKEPAAIKAISLARREHYIESIIASAEEWVPIVRRMRPDHPWKQVLSKVNRSLPPGADPWSLQRLMRAVHRYVQDGMLERQVLGRSPAPVTDDPMILTVAAMAGRNPRPSVSSMVTILNKVHRNTPNQKPWTYARVRNLLEKARKMGILE